MAPVHGEPSRFFTASRDCVCLWDVERLDLSGPRQEFGFQNTTLIVPLSDGRMAVASESSPSYEGALRVLDWRATEARCNKFVMRSITGVSEWRPNQLFVASDHGLQLLDLRTNTILQTISGLSPLPYTQSPLLFPPFIAWRDFLNSKLMYWDSVTPRSFNLSGYVELFALCDGRVAYFDQFGSTNPHYNRFNIHNPFNDDVISVDMDNKQYRILYQCLNGDLVVHTGENLMLINVTTFKCTYFKRSWANRYSELPDGRIMMLYPNYSRGVHLLDIETNHARRLDGQRGLCLVTNAQKQSWAKTLNSSLPILLPELWQIIVSY
jgi:hypothetical protein